MQDKIHVVDILLEEEQLIKFHMSMGADEDKAKHIALSELKAKYNHYDIRDN
jgi:hypothetical protein